MERTLKAVSIIVGLVIVALFVQFVTTTKFSQLQERKGLFSSDISKLNKVEEQLNCLAINIYREAGHEPFEGKVGVAQVTMNRVQDSNFPNDVCQVVYQKNKVVEKVVCQFSWHCDRTVKTRPIDPDAYAESYAVAKKVLLEGFRLDILKDALFYHATYVNPRWKHVKIGQIGQHIFYKVRV